jgi:hypothetical protein
MNTADVISLCTHRRALLSYRSCFTSSLPLDESGFEFPRSDSDYLFWLSCPQMLIVTPTEIVRSLSCVEMQLLADAAHGLHLLYTKYSIMAAPAPPASTALVAVSRAPNARSPSPADCALISTRLVQCRFYDEIVSWYRWHGYALSTTTTILHRAQHSEMLPIPLLQKYMSLEIMLSACLCAYPAARLVVMSPHVNGNCIRLTTKVFNLLREGNHMNVPISESAEIRARPHRSHLDMPDFFYSLPFHYLHSSVLAEAWFAAPSVSHRRRLIRWPSHMDAAGAYPCPITKLWEAKDIPETLYKPTRVGSGPKTPRTALHPQLEFIYDLLKSAILSDNIRVKWRSCYSDRLEQATAKLTQGAKLPQGALHLKRQLYLSLIFGDVRDVPNYKPPESFFGYKYNFISTVDSVECIPLCYQPRVVSHIPGYSLPVRGPSPHPPRLSFYENVQAQIAAFQRGIASPPDPSLRLSHSDSGDRPLSGNDESDASLIRAFTPMVEAATDWARALIHLTRDPQCPDSTFFPPLEQPATAPSDDSDVHLPADRRHLILEDDIEVNTSAAPILSDDD